MAQRRQQGPDLIAGVAFDARAQIAGGHALELLADALQRTHHRARHVQIAARDHAHDQQQQGRVHIKHDGFARLVRGQRLAAQLVQVGREFAQPGGEGGAGLPCLHILQLQVGRVVVALQRLHHFVQGGGEAAEAAGQAGFHGTAQLGQLGNFAKRFDPGLGFAHQLLDGVLVLQRAGGIAAAPLHRRDVRANRGPQHLRIGVLEQAALLHAHAIERMQGARALPDAFPPQRDGNQCRQCQRH
ncbi:Uncharacterised protein [Mycobacteroides abscessus subsp. abscessus]|nr:Uncharacterised protein [Mycobacteroides abscessus subsp. abscessus]